MESLEVMLLGVNVEYPAVVKHFHLHQPLFVRKRPGILRSASRFRIHDQSINRDLARSQGCWFVFDRNRLRFGIGRRRRHVWAYRARGNVFFLENNRFTMLSFATDGRKHKEQSDDWLRCAWLR